MSGLKNVLGNVYGDPDDRPTQPDLDDVQDSMDALTESVDATDESAAPQPETTESALDELDGWVDGLEQASEPAATAAVESEPAPAEDDLDDPLAAFAEPTVDATGDDFDFTEDLPFDSASDDDPWAMIDGDDDSPADDGHDAELSSTTDQTSAAPETATTDSWLDVVDGGDADDDDWMNEYQDADVVHEDAPETTDDLGPADVVEFELETGDTPDTDQISAALEAAVAGATDVATPASETTDEPTHDDAPEGEDAWLDDLFSIDEEMAEPAAPVDDTGVIPVADDADALVEAISDPAPTTAEMLVTDEVTHDLGSVTAAISAPAPEPTFTPTTAPSGFEHGWNRTDDDILPQAGGGGRGKAKTKSKKKRRGKDDVAIEIDTHQLDRLASLPTPPTAEDTDPDAQPALSDETAVVDDTEFAPMDLELGGDSPAPAMHDAPLQSHESMLGFVTPPSADFTTPDLTASDLEGSLEADDPVHLFAPDAELDEAAAAGRGRRGRRAKKVKQPKAEKEPRAKRERAPKEPKAEKEPKAKRGRGNKEPKAPKEPKAKRESKRGRRRKAEADDTDAALMAQVDAAIATHAANSTAMDVAADDDFWGDAATTAASVDPAPMHGVADPLDVELIQPPTSYDPGPVLD